MAKVKHEFQCSECLKFFDVKLNTALNGNYRIHCPNCKHIHYRKIEKGKITIHRFDTHSHAHSLNDILIEDIRPMKASCRDFRTETHEEALSIVENPAAAILENKEAYAAGLMSNLLKEKFSGRM